MGNPVKCEERRLVVNDSLDEPTSSSYITEKPDDDRDILLGHADDHDGDSERFEEIAHCESSKACETQYYGEIRHEKQCGEKEPSIRLAGIWQLLLIAIKHVFWLIITSLPAIVVVSAAGFGYSKLPWTRQCPSVGVANNSSQSQECTYFNVVVLFVFDDIFRSGLIAVLNIVVASVMFVGLRGLWRNLLFIAFPLITAVSGIFAALIFVPKKPLVWFYYLDIVLFMAVFFLVLPLAHFNISKHEQAVKFGNSFKYYVAPMFFMALGIGFVDIYFSKTYRVEKDGTPLKYIQRLIVYPIIMDLFLSFGEFFVRRLNNCSVHGRAHSLYLIQVRFGILGRYMTITSGDLASVTITSCAVAIKDVFFHRMSRFQCWLAFKLRRFFPCYQGDDEATDFHEWFFDEDFCNFRGCVINNEFLHEFTAAVVTPILVILFRSHRTLFKFDDVFHDDDNDFNVEYFIKQEAVQLVLLTCTYLLIIFIEAKYNNVDLRISYSRRNRLQDVSQVIIYLWGMLQVLSAVRVIPNYFQCHTNYICDCNFHIVKADYGCF
eukprot:gene9354-10339_t